MQLVQISERIAQAIDVIDAQSGERIFRDQAQNEAVSGLKYNWIFDPNSDQISDGEEAAIIDALIQVLPERQLVILFREQTLQETKTAGIAFFAVDVGDIFLDKVRDFSAAGHEGSEAVASRFKAQSPFGRSFRGASIGTCEFPDRREDSGIFVVGGSVFSQNFFQTIEAMIQEWRDRSEESAETEESKY